MTRQKPSVGARKPISSWHVLFLALGALNSVAGGPIQYQRTSQTPQQTQTVPVDQLTFDGESDMPRGGREELVTQLKEALKAIEKSIELPYELGSIKIDFSNPYSLLLYVVFTVIPAIKTILNESKETAKTKKAKEELEKIDKSLKAFLETSSAKLLIKYHKYGRLENSSDVFALVGSYHQLQNFSVELSSQLSQWLEQHGGSIEIEQRKEMNEIIGGFEKVSRLSLDEVNPEKLKRDLDTFLDELHRLTEKK